MISRIQKLLQLKNLTASRLADEIGVPRSSVSHILNGRNNPSLEFLQKVLTRYPDVNTDWLIQGNGTELKSEPDLFSQDVSSHSESRKTISELNITDRNPSSEILSNSQRDKSADNSTQLSNKQSVNKPLSDIRENIKSEEKPKTPSIERIIVFFSDNTFMEYTPGNNTN